MSAMPSLTASLPEPVLSALIQAHEFTTGAAIGLGIMTGILAEIRKEAEASGAVSDAVDALEERLSWVVEHMHARVWMLPPAVLPHRERRHGLPKIARSSRSPVPIPVVSWSV